MIAGNMKNSKVIRKHFKNMTGKVHWSFGYVCRFSNCVHGVALLFALALQFIYC
jgi:hypothetical protein